MQLNFAMVISKRNNNRSKASLIALIPTILSISSVLFMVGLLALFLIGSKKLTDKIKETFEITVSLTDDATKEQAIELKNKFLTLPEINAVEFKDKAAAAKAFEEEIGQEFTEIIDNPLPHLLILNIKAELAQELDLNAFEEKLKEYKEVAYVDYQTGLLENINRNVNKVLLVLIGITGLFTLISIALINSTIRLSLFAKRFIIKSMQYVGATDWFIMKPFLKQFFWYAVISSFIAILGLGSVVFALRQYSINAGVLIDQPTFLIISGFLMLFAIALIWLSTNIAVKRYLSLQSNQLN